MIWRIEIKSFGASNGFRDRQLTVEAPTALAALEASWPDREFQIDEDDERYFSIVTPPGQALVAGRIIPLKE